MKKIVALLLALILCFSLCACGAKSENEDINYVISLLERGEYDMAIRVIEMLRDQGTGASAKESGEEPVSPAPKEEMGEDPVSPAPQEETSEPSDTIEFVFENQVPEDKGSDLIFIFPIHNETEHILTLKSWDVINYMGGGQGDTFHHTGEEFIATPFYTLTPGVQMEVTDGHPKPTPFDQRRYEFIYMDENGTEYNYTFWFDTSMYAESQGGGNDFGNYPEAKEVDCSEDGAQDLERLRINAAFENKVADGVYWVPVAALGGSRYSNKDILAMVDKSPEEKQEAISTLYEAMQLFQISRFRRADDNTHTIGNGMDWEFHTPGYAAVANNCGCCATVSDWLHYILADDYDEIGFIAFSMPDGSGHVFNYIKQDSWYYTIDMTHYVNDDMMPPAVEDGDMEKYYQSDFVLGNIHRSKSLSKFTDYIKERFTDPPVLITRYTATDVPAVSTVRAPDNSVRILYADMNGIQVEVLLDKPNDNLTFELSPPPADT